LGGKWEEVENNLLLFLLSKRWTRMIEVSFFSLDIIFNSILRILVFTSFLRRKRMIGLGSWEKEGE